MIRLIQGADRLQYSYEMDRMHTIRAEVFHERLRWDVKVEEGWEIDVFDDHNPLYLLSVDPETNEVRGSVRLLPTTGPNMLRDVFHALLPDDLIIEDPLIWESSRFSIDPNYPCRTRSDCQINEVTAELLIGMAEIGRMIGLKQIVSVYDATMARLFRRANCKAEIVGKPMRFGKVMTYAGLFDTNDKMIEDLQKASGLSGSVLEKAAPNNPLFALNT